jgi:hypothetical protein
MREVKGEGGGVYVPGWMGSLSWLVSRSVGRERRGGGVGDGDAVVAIFGCLDVVM